MAEEIQDDNRKNPELIRLLQSVAKSESAADPISNNNCGDCEWTTDETNCLLKLITECEYLAQMKSENEQVYNKLSKQMAINGYSKTNLDIKSYWRDLKQKLGDYRTGQLENFQFSDQINNLLESNASCHSEPEMIVIKGEELDGNILESSEIHNFCMEDSEQKNGRGIRRNNWTHKETECVVEVLEKYGMPNRTNLRKFCYIVVDHLKQNGFMRSEEQAQIKMKHLRALYNQVVRKSLKEAEFPFFNRIKVVMQAHETIMKFNDNEETTEEQSKSSDMDDNANLESTEDDMATKKGRQIWNNKEIRVLLKFIEDNNIVTGKQLRKMVNKAMEYLASYGFYRSPTQILIRWKNTKAVYWSTFRKKLPHPERECSFFYQLHNILNPDDCSYETKIIEDGTEDDACQNGDASTDSKIEMTKFHFNKITQISERDNFVNLQNNSNSSDTFVNINNSFVPKRFPITDVPVDPLENEDSKIVIPSSPKRSRTEQTQSTPASCSFCSMLDPVDHYCVSLAHSIKRLNARKQAKLKIEIQQLMYKAEFDPDF